MLRHGSFSFSRNFFFFSTPTLYQIGEALKKKISSRVCMYARIVENNNSLELFIFFYRNTLVFLFIKRKVSEEMPFSSEVFRIYWHNFRKNGNNFGRNRHNFGSYCYKWVRNFDRKMPKNGHF